MLMIIIPARYQSSRFPGKPLALLKGRPMIQWVVERCRQARLADRVLVATDDERIVQTVREMGGEAELTKADHASGTDRIAEVAGRHPDVSWLINVQGDEPDIAPALIDRLAEELQKSSAETIVTACTPITCLDDFLSPHVVKVVTDQAGRALYFSRSAIPHHRDLAGKDLKFPNPCCRQHVGIYGFHRSFLQQLPALRPGILEEMEKLEQLRWLENGYRIQVVTTEYHSKGIDTPKDLTSLADRWEEKK
ncbi:MAG: 3-deoxy-manno-octulosonate cytidylyltransferase [Deltaproteobacteria bacterium]|nr:3-deoxy-manno-octulosonate cytidylyltransferase [Candidatus Anaeroferrophillus wilburensis]MBN2889738.1 3-deoxy-manno-octulosonate cytidylyltransferase [Deltaproteobacteria bacterium]